MSITAFIVDDELESRAALQEMLHQFCPDVRVLGSADNVEDAIQQLRSLKPELLFLDINLGDKTGFDLLDILHRYDCNIIFVTAYEHFALKAFEYAATNYLLKPIDYKKLIESVDRIRQQKEALAGKGQQRADAASSSAIIALPDMNKTDFVQPDQIIYLEGKGPYTVFYLENGIQYTKSKNLKYYEEMLAGSSQFIRAHKSYIVNKTHIKAYRKATSELECTNNIIIPTSLSNKALLDLL